MPGEIWRGQLQIGKEVTAGTGVPATRILYANTDLVLTRARAPKPHMFMTGTRDNTRALTVGPVEAGGTVKLPISSSEILEYLLIGVAGGVTPTTPSGGVTARQWVFKPSLTLDSSTLEWFDGSRAWQGTGYQMTSWAIDGSVSGDNTFTANLFGQNLAPLSALTGSLVSRTPSFFEGFETKLYIDPYGGTAGTTAVPGTLTAWALKGDNQMARQYTANNTLAASATPVGELVCTADLTFVASSANALNEFNFWENGTASPTLRLVRLEFGNNAILDTPSTAVGTTTSITESGTTATYTVGNSLTVGQAVNVTGATPAGYNGTNLRVTRASSTSFDVTLPVAGLANATVQGTVTGGTPITSKIWVDLPGGWTVVDLGQTDAGTRAYRFSFQYVFDVTNAYGYQFTLINNRTTAY
jgi:hypothetical protein